MRPLRELTLIVLVVLLGLGASQVPRFVQEYEQRLGGARDEAERQLLAQTQLAAGESLTIEALIERLRANPDAVAARQGDLVRDLVGRVAYLRGHAAALEAAGPFERVWLAARDGDGAIRAAAWEKFGFALTLDPWFGLVGIVLAWVLNMVLWNLPRPRRRRVFAARA